MRAFALILLVTSGLVAACGEDPAAISTDTTGNSSNYLTSSSALTQAYATPAPSIPTSVAATPAPTASVTLAPARHGLEAKLVQEIPHGFFTKTLEVAVQVTNYDDAPAHGYLIVTFTPSKELAYRVMTLEASSSQTISFTSTKAADTALVEFRDRLL